MSVKTGCAKSDEEAITCPVCQTIYDKPMRLVSCQHTVCGGCIEWTGDSLHKFTCPVCGKASAEVFRDHAKQALIQVQHKHLSLKVQMGGKSQYSSRLDSSKYSSIGKGSHNDIKTRVQAPVDQNSNSKASRLKCQMCEAPTKLVEWKCVECDKVLCQSCKVVHEAIPTCKTHYVKNLSTAAQDIKSAVQKCRCTMLNSQNLTSGHLDEFFKFRNKVEQSAEEALAAIGDHEDMCLKVIQEHHQALRNNVNDAKDQLKQTLDKEERQLQSCLGNIKRNREALAKIESAEDEDEVLYLYNLNGKDIEEFAGQLESVVPVAIHPPSLEIRVERKDQIDISHSISVQPMVKPITVKYRSEDEPDMTSDNNNTLQSDVQDFNFMGLDYADILKHTYKTNKSFPLQYSPRRLNIINDQIWCAGTAAIYIYNKDGSLISTVTHDNLKQVKSLTQTKYGDVIVACWDGKGLLQLDHTGAFQTHILQGSFSDVSACGDNVYALSYEDTTVHVMSKAGGEGQWMVEREIKLGYNNGNNWDSLYVHTNIIQVCSWQNNCIYQYNRMGHVLSQYGGIQSNTSTTFHHPRICDADHHGNLMVVDTDNGKIKVQDSSGNWGFVTHTTDINRPIDAVVDSKTGALWLIQNNPGKTHRLHRLVKKETEIHTVV